MNNNVIKSSTSKQKSAQRKFNIIDFFVLALIVAVIGVSIYAVISWSDIKSLWSTSTVNLQYIVEFRGVDQAFINKINDGDIVIDAVSKNQLGVVDSVATIDKYKVLDYKLTQEDTNGATTPAMYTGELVSYPDKYNITVYISTSAEYKEGVGYTVNGRRIAVGEKIEMRFPEFSGIGYCITFIENSN